MYKITIRYVLVLAAVMAVCLTIQVIPNPPAMVVDHRGSNVGPPPSRLHHFLSSWPIEFGTFFVGIATGMHLLTSVVGMSGWRRWLTAICVPTSAFTAWYAYSVRYLNQHPGSLGEGGHVQLGVIGFTVGYAVVTIAVLLSGLMVSRSGFATPDRTQASRPEESAE